MPQSLATVIVHGIFSTKNRHPWLLAEWQSDLFRVVGSVIGTLDCHPIVVGGVADHMHILFELGRTITIADAMGRLKANSSHWINVNHGRVIPFQWQGGYAAFSVSPVSVDLTRNYILTQETHHKKRSFQDELRDCFRKAGIEWDERYVWD